MKVKISLKQTDLNPQQLKNVISEEMIRYFQLNYNEDTLKILDDYLKNNLFLNLSASQIILLALKNLKINNNQSEYFIDIDKNILIPQTSYKLYDLAYLFEYGNIQLKGYHIISNIYNYIINNIEYIL